MLWNAGNDKRYIYSNVNLDLFSAMNSVDSVTDVFQEAGKIIIAPPTSTKKFCGFSFFK